MSEKTEKTKKGIHLKSLVYVLVGISVFLAFYLFFLTSQMRQAYNDLSDATEDYIDWQVSASDLMIASDFLTEQARCYAETGDIAYINRYFDEAENVRRRDRAVLVIKEALGDTDIPSILQEALDESETLMEREFLSMKVKALSLGVNLNDLPAKVRDCEVPERILTSTQGAMSETARRLVFDSPYRFSKEFITSKVEDCIDRIKEEISVREAGQLDRLDRMETIERVVVLALIAALVLMAIVVFFGILLPISRAAGSVAKGEPIEVRGTKEFRFFARTYNSILESDARRKEELEYAATHDALTGVYNRGSFDKFLRDMDMEDTSLLVVDIDHFKRINDTCGHNIGDKVLRLVGDTLRTSFRGSDLICRVGGDEFVVFLVGIGPDQKDVIIKKIKGINEKLKVPEGDMPAISISAGVSCGRGFGPEAVYRRADEALYRTKENGRAGCTYLE